MKYSLGMGATGFSRTEYAELAFCDRWDLDAFEGILYFLVPLLKHFHTKSYVQNLNTIARQEGAAVEGPPAMGPSLQLSTNRRREQLLPWQRGHPGRGSKGSLRHLPNIKLIRQQAAKLWGFFANNAISRHDLDLWPLDPWQTDGWTDRRTALIHDGASF